MHQASKGVGFLEYYVFASAVGGDVAETGDGPGSFRVGGNIWHFECCNPEVRALCFSSFAVIDESTMPPGEYTDNSSPDRPVPTASGNSPTRSLDGTILRHMDRWARTLATGCSWLPS